MAFQKLGTLILWHTVALGTWCRKWQLVLPTDFPASSISTRAGRERKSAGWRRQWMVQGSCATGNSNSWSSLYFFWKQRNSGVSFCPKEEVSLPSSANTSSVTSTVCVTYRGIIVMPNPLPNTIAAASGSTRMLNSADGEQFPSPIAPPISVTPRSRGFMSGKARRMMARLVRAPVTTNSTGSACAMICWQMCRKGFSVMGSLGDRASGAPSSPLSPWMAGAVLRGLQSGSGAPLTTGISSLPISWRMSSAFLVVFSMVELPEEVETPRRWRFWEQAAMMMASMSSCPGSQSSHTFILFTQQPQMQGAQSSEQKQLLDRMRAAFNDLKANYVQFLGSLRYENLAERRKLRSRVKRVEQIEGDEGWENNITREFNFEEEMLSQNSGYLTFLRLLDNLKRLEDINSEIALGVALAEDSTTNAQQIAASITFMENVEKKLPGIYGFPKEKTR